MIDRTEYLDEEWEQTEYSDVHGKPLRWDSSDGFWKIWEYDENGNETRFEDSGGFWKNSKYDENGKIVRIDRSDGDYSIIEYGNGSQRKETGLRFGHKYALISGEYPEEAKKRKVEDLERRTKELEAAERKQKRQRWLDGKLS